MAGSSHASVDIGRLACSLKEELKTLRLRSGNRCIYRIPKRIRQLSESECTPRAISIGPFHHGREELKDMEEYKLLCLQDYLKRNQVSIEDLLVYIKDREVELRECYAETVNMGSHEFVKMILVDAAFIIEFLLIIHGVDVGENHFAVTSHSVLIDIGIDIWKLENQLPLFILKGLFALAMSAISTDHCERFLLSKLTLSLLKVLLPDDRLFIEEDLVEGHFDKARHLLDWVRLCFQPPELGTQRRVNSLTTPTITKLEQAGVKFKSVSRKQLFDIRFRNGILEIPRLSMVGPIKCIFTNLMALEQLYSATHYVNDYIQIMNQIVKTPKDEEILVQNLVIENLLWESKGGVAVIRMLANESSINPANYYYSGLVEQLNAYSSVSWYQWKAILRQNYFNTPWASISVVGAAILLILTFIQTVCSIIAL